MKVGIIVISNRPVDLEKFYLSLNTVPELSKRAVLLAVIQPPFKGDEWYLKGFDHVTMLEAEPEPTPFVMFRKMAMMAANDCDVFLSLDDDHRFCDPPETNKLNKKCDLYYREVFDFLESHPKVGVMTLKGYLGGYEWGYEFRINPKNGLITTGKGGLILRNIGVQKIIPAKDNHLRGAMFETLAGYNIMAKGYDYAKRFNSPVKSRAVGREKHIDISTNKSYSLETVNANIQGRIRKRFNDPGWLHTSKKYPRLIEEMINENRS